MSYSDLSPFATVRQLEYIEAIEGSQGSTYKAAKALGIPDLHLHDMRREANTGCFGWLV